VFSNLGKSHRHSTRVCDMCATNKEKPDRDLIHRRHVQEHMKKTGSGNAHEKKDRRARPIGKNHLTARFPP